MPLNAQQKKFARLYAKKGHVTKAAIAAGYSKKTAYSQGSDLLKKPEIAALVEKHQQAAAERAEITIAKVLAELGKHAFADIAKLYDQDGNLKPIHEMAKGARTTIQSIETDELYAGRGESRVKIGYNRKVKTTDKLKALELIGRHLKMFTDVHEHSGKDGGPFAFLQLPANGSESEEHPSPAHPETPETREEG